MATIRLRWNASAKPVLADRDGEVDTNWADNGNHSLSASATQARTGSKSFKITATDTGDLTTNYVSLASGNNATFVVGKNYVLTLYSYATGSETFKIKTAGVESSTYTATNSWTAHHFYFTAVSATTALQVAITKGGGGELYFELEPIEEALEFTTPISVKGFDEPDAVEFFPSNVQNDYLDGSVEDQMTSFRRRITVDLGVIATAANRKSVLHWMIDPDRRIDYSTEVGIEVALADPSAFQNEWRGGTELGRAFVLDLRERSVRTTFPV